MNYTRTEENLFDLNNIQEGQNGTPVLYLEENYGNGFLEPQKPPKNKKEAENQLPFFLVARGRFELPTSGL